VLFKKFKYFNSKFVVLKFFLKKLPKKYFPWPSPKNPLLTKPQFGCLMYEINTKLKLYATLDRILKISHKFPRIWNFIWPKFMNSMASWEIYWIIFYRRFKKDIKYEILLWAFWKIYTALTFTLYKHWFIFKKLKKSDLKKYYYSFGIIV